MEAVEAVGRVLLNTDTLLQDCNMGHLEQVENSSRFPLQLLIFLLIIYAASSIAI